MKSLPFILFVFTLTLSARAQEGSVPPAPGSVPVAPAAPVAVPTRPEPAAPDASAPGSVTTISGGALPPDGSIAATTPPPAPGPSIPGEAADSDSSGAPAAPATDAIPPGMTASGEKDGAAKVDFLQRSNLILAKLLDSERAVDPFGLTMDPANAKAAPVLADQYEEVEETTVVNNSMLKNALLTLPITGIYPQRGLIVIGARSFKVGEQFGMKLQDLTIRLRFEGVRDGEVFFKDMETREVTSVPFNTLPAEFEPLVKGSKRTPGSGIVPMNELYIAN